MSPDAPVDLTGTTPARLGAPCRGWLPDIRGKGAVVALTLFLIPVLVAPGFVDGQAVYRPLDIHATVTDVVREHGTHADLLTFTVTLTNTGSGVTSIELIYLWDQSKHSTISDSCLGTVHLMPDGTMQLELCFPVLPTTIPKALMFVDLPQQYDLPTQRHVLPFASGQCGDGYLRDHSCQTIQPIASITRDIEPEPMEHEAPAPVTVSPALAQEDAATVPSWVRKVAGWWSEGLVSDSQFLEGIKYLIDNGIMVVGSTYPVADPDNSCQEAAGEAQTITWSLQPQNSFDTQSYEMWLGGLGGLDTARNAVAAGLNAWAEANPSLLFVESQNPSRCGHPHLNVIVGVMPDHYVIGHACLDCLHDGAHMVLDEEWWVVTATSIDVPFNAVSVRNVVAHEFGHILGLEHKYGDPLHLMQEFYAEELYCTPAGLSSKDYGTGLMFEYDDRGRNAPPYDDRGWNVPEYAVEVVGFDPNQSRHHSADFFAEQALYDRIARTLYITFSQDVLDAYVDYVRLTGSDRETSTLRGSEVIYRGNVVEIRLPESRGEKFDDILCADLEIGERSVMRSDTTYALPQTLIVKVLR